MCALTSCIVRPPEECRKHHHGNKPKQKQSVSITTRGKNSAIQVWPFVFDMQTLHLRRKREHEDDTEITGPDDELDAFC